MVKYNDDKMLKTMLKLSFWLMLTIISDLSTLCLPLQWKSPFLRMEYQWDWLHCP